MSFYYQVAVNFPKKNSLLTYKSKIEYRPGSFVEVPLGKRGASGLVWEDLKEDNLKDLNPEKIKPISSLLQEEINLNEKEREFFFWIASYYHYSLGKLIFDSFPKFLKRPRKTNYLLEGEEKSNLLLNREQEKISSKIKLFLKKEFSQHLIHGVTGSGKSVICLDLIKEVIKKKKSVLYMLPEINLTPQFIDFFTNSLEVDFFVYHSSLSASHRFELVKDLTERKKPYLLLGVRSSILLPLRNLGLIIVDEEHDQSFKQTDRCPYHARDVAIKKAQIEEIPILLCSATPCLESLFRFKKGQNFYTLKSRFGEAKMPEICLVDERSQEEFSSWPIHPKSINLLKKALEKKEQALVFINRLGFSHYIQCSSCGYVFECLNCSLALKYFKKENALCCSHCDLKVEAPKICPECQCITLYQKGFGTEKVKEVLETIFPEKKIERFDRDEVKNLKILEERLNLFHEGKIDILVGTQMLSKGHNFKKVNTVLVLGTDNLLNSSDFRAQEHVFQTLYQISGRAGRFSDKGRVFVQTKVPSLDLFSELYSSKFDEFYKREIEVRKSLFYPPFSKILEIRVEGRVERICEEVAEKLAFCVREICKKNHFKIDLLGPKPAVIYKKKNKFFRALLIKSGKGPVLGSLMNDLEASYKSPSGIKIKFLRDPLSLS